MAQSAPITTSITITVVMPYASATIPKIGVKIPPKLADNPMVTLNKIVPKPQKPHRFHST